MNMIKKAAMSAQKRNQRIAEFINVENFLYFYSHYAFEKMGTDKKGFPTTLQTSIGEIAKLANSGFVGELALETTNFYKSRCLYNMVELSDTERAKRSSKLFDRAANKILWLNTMCKELTGVSFLACLVDKSNPDQVRELVVAFCDAIDR